MNQLNQILLTQLQDFGLDPRDWRLEISKSVGEIFQVRIFNLTENGLVLHGFADQAAWLDLSYQG